MRGSRGFSLVETALALALTLVVAAGVFAVVRSAQEAAVAQPEINDLQQRLRIASDVIYADLVLAGAPAVGVDVQPLSQTIPTVLPFRAGPIQPDSPGTHRANLLTVVYAVAGSSQTTTLQALTPGSVGVPVRVTAGCPLRGSARDPACGFTAGAAVLVFDRTGAYDHFTVTDVIGNLLMLQQSGGGLSRSYPAGSSIVQVKRITYHLNTATAQLMRYNGVASDVPAVDDVADLRFEYFGRDETGEGALVPLSPEELTDGPWRPDAVHANRYDADLLRIGRVAVHLRLRTAARVSNVPEIESRFDVSPRSLNR
ncbi:MAG: hypothetical protein GEU82_07365 [Luteitalea sp.]|nr:hypothetical protein [Luteitalea sp.]